MDSVEKFGGTSAARPEAIRQRVEDCVSENAIIAVSAPGRGPDSDKRMTDELRLFHKNSLVGNIAGAESHANEIIERMDSLYAGHVGSSFRNNMLNIMRGYLNPHQGMIREFAETRGEVFSAMYLAEMIGARYEDSAIHLNKDGTVNREKTDTAIREQCALAAGRLVVPGFIAIGANGHVTTLGSGGSDRTGTNYARALDVVNTNWTDGGIASADPQVIKNVSVLSEVTRGEVHEAHFGGNRVLQGDSIADLDGSNVEVIVRSTFDLDAPNTKVNQKLSHERDHDIAMVTGKTDLLMINIYDPSMAYRTGYGGRILSDFSKVGLSFEHMPAGQGSFCLTTHIDSQNPEKTLEQVEKFKEVVESDRLISQVGSVSIERSGVVYVVGENLRDTDKNRDATIRIMQAAQSVGARALPVSNGLSPSIAILTGRESVDELVKAVHAQEIENRD